MSNATETKVKSIKILVDMDDGNGPQVVQEWTHNLKTMEGFIFHGDIMVEDVEGELVDRIYNFASEEIEKYQDDNEDLLQKILKTIQPYQYGIEDIGCRSGIILSAKVSDVSGVRRALDAQDGIEMTFYDKKYKVWTYNPTDDDAPNQFGILIHSDGAVSVELI